MADTSDRPACRTVSFSPAQSQRAFRVLVEALAHPGVVHHLAPSDLGDVPAVFTPVLCLATPEVTLAMIDGDGLPVEAPYADPQLAGLLRRTGVRPAAALAEADMVMARRAPFPELIEEIRGGAAPAAERAARVFIGCEHLSTPNRRSPVPSPNMTRIWLIGRGATNGRAVDVDGAPAALFEQIAGRNAAPSAGIDTWLIDDDGAVVGVPRSSRLEVVASATR